MRNHQLGNFDHTRHGGVRFHKKINFGLLFQKLSLGTQKLFCKVLDQLDTRLNNYGLINSQSMLIYHLKLTNSCISETAARIAKITIFSNNFGLLFQKWSLCTQESFCKVSDQLDTQLNNYGLISRHTFINCVNNCTFIFTRHQPRLFLKALLVVHWACPTYIGKVLFDSASYVTQ